MTSASLNREALTGARSTVGRYGPPLSIVIAGLAAYANSYSAPFVFDDAGSITDNPTIRRLASLGQVLSPPSGGLTVSGRPIVNLSLALNYALGGLRVEGYHLVNVAIHLLAALTLFGIARRMFRSHPGIAFGSAVIWAVHPLQTEAVTYLVQRAESLMGLFYLLTLYCFIRSADGPTGSGGASPRGDSTGQFWSFGAVIACAAGMASKEDMVSAPLIVLLYDRTFLAGTFATAWRRRRALYLGLAASWLILGWLVAGGGGNRGGSMGFVAGTTWWAYGLTQFPAVVHYAWLAVWPHPLVFEYGIVPVTSWREIAPDAVVVMLLVGATLWALWRRPAWGFLGFWFFAVLAPTSLVSAATQTIVEHRMYLALAPLLMALLWAGDELLIRTVERAGSRSAVGAAVVACFTAVCLVLTIRRNADYRDHVTLWADTVAQRPANPIARNNLGVAWEERPGHLPEAIAAYQTALRLKPDYVEAHRNLGMAWLKMPGRRDAAIGEFETALRLDPSYAMGHNSLGTALEEIPGRLSDAIAEYEEALHLDPNYVLAHINLGSAWLRVPGRSDDAIAQFEAALRLDPDSAEAHNDLGNAWARLPGRIAAAVEEYEAALRVRPDYAAAHNNLGNVWVKLPGRANDAVAEFETALRLQPDYAEAHYNLGNAWAQMPGRLDDAIGQYQQALRLNPDYAAARNNLGNSLNSEGRTAEAIVQYQLALRLQPEVAAIHLNLAIAILKTAGATREAVAHLEAVLRLQPANATARQLLAQIQTH